MKKWVGIDHKDHPPPISQSIRGNRLLCCCLCCCCWKGLKYDEGGGDELMLDETAERDRERGGRRQMNAEKK